MLAKLRNVGSSYGSPPCHSLRFLNICETIVFPGFLHRTVCEKRAGEILNRVSVVADAVADASRCFTSVTECDGEGTLRAARRNPRRTCDALLAHADLQHVT